MSLGSFAAGSPLSANFPAPSDSDQWLPQDFADDLFGGTSELSQALSGDTLPKLQMCSAMHFLLNANESMKCS